MRGSKGFTYIELFVVLVLIATITLVAAPRIILISEKYKLEAAAWKLTGDLRHVQNAAIVTGESGKIVFYKYNGCYKITLPQSEKGKIVSLPEGIEFETTNFPVEGGFPTLYFHSTGAPSRGGTIVLKNRRGVKLYVIVTVATGRVRISTEPPATAIPRSGSGALDGFARSTLELML